MLEETEKLIDVFETNDDSEAMVVRSLLESGGFPLLMSTVEAPAGVFPFNAMPLGHIKVQVPESHAEEAMRVIAEYQRRGPQDAERAELETEESEELPPSA
jgi:hypothetical protein